MAFETVIRSIGGITTGAEFNPPLGLSDIYATVEPDPTDANNLRNWQFGAWGSSTFDPLSAFNSVDGVMQSYSGLYDFLQGTTVNNRKVLMEFRIDESSLADKVTLCLEAWANGTNMIVRPCRRVYDDDNPGVYTRTEYSAQRPIVMDNHRIKFLAGNFSRGGTDYIGIGVFTCRNDAAQAIGEIYYINVESFRNLFGGGVPSGRKFSPQYGVASGIAGYGQSISGGGTHTRGSFDDSSDIIALDNKPQVGVTTAGFINVYKITQGQLNTLGEKLFPHFLPAEILADPSQMTTPEMLAVIVKMFYGALICPVGAAVELADNLGIIDIIMNGKLIDYVIDCHIIPCSISDATVEGLRVGYRQFNDLQLAKATEDYVDVDLGSLTIPEYWANFLDYANGVICELFLPFVGFVPIDPEYWNGGEISIVYRFNIVDGSFQAKVFATSSKSQLTSSLIGQYGGVACVHLPISGLQYANVIAGLVNGSAATAASAAGGNIGGAVSNIANMAMLRPDAPMSNGYNASSSFLSHRTPYLIIKRATAQFSERYPQEMGLPLNVQEKLSNVHGFTVIDNPRLNIACSDRECDELITLLKSGVIL